MFASIKEIVGYARSYYQSAFHRFYFCIIAAVLAGILFVHYFLPWQIMNGNSLQHFLAGYGLYFFPYAFAFLLQYIFFPHLSFLRSRWFWTLVILAPALFAFRSTFNFQLNLPAGSGLADQDTYWLQIFKLITRSLLLIIPVYFIWWIRDKNNQRPYGLNRLQNTRPFFLLLVLMIPFLLVAGFLPGFSTTYPIVLKAVGGEFAGRTAASWLFELCYAIDLFSIELFFRGFLVLAFVHICGMHAIIPAAVFYCCIHLGKPMPEAVSSFFGGLLLGIISYHNKSIWGGLIVHAGIAWLMEIVALLHYLT